MLCVMAGVVEPGGFGYGRSPTMGVDEPAPRLFDPAACSCRRVARVGEVSEAGLGGFDDLVDTAVGCWVVEGVALRAEGVAGRGLFDLQEWEAAGGLVVGVEALEAVTDLLELLVAEGPGGGCAIGGDLRASELRDGAASGGVNDGHAVGVGEGPGAADVGDGPFRQIDSLSERCRVRRWQRHPLSRDA